MPAAYAHYRFGKDVLECLPFLYRKPIEKYRELYDIGLHGPDILFYYKPLSANPVNQTGFGMHDRPGEDFFGKALEKYKLSENPEAMKAYLSGFICHFVLDSTCHPYIEKMMEKSGLSHTEIETELERYFMTKDGKKPSRYVPVQHIHVSDETSNVIASCFDSISPEEITDSLTWMIRFLKLLHVSGSKKRTLLYLGLHIIRKYNDVQGLIMKAEINETCKKYCVILNKLYTEAVTVAASLIQQYTNTLDHDQPLSPRFALTFGAGDKWKELII